MNPDVSNALKKCYNVDILHLTMQPVWKGLDTSTVSEAIFFPSWRRRSSMKQKSKFQPSSGKRNHLFAMLTTMTAVALYWPWLILKISIHSFFKPQLIPNQGHRSPWAWRQEFNLDRLTVHIWEHVCHSLTSSHHNRGSPIRLMCTFLDCEEKWNTQKTQTYKLQTKAIRIIRRLC